MLKPEELRETLIAEKLRAGIEPAIIAQAMNMPPSAIGNVVAKLAAGGRPGQPSRSEAM